MKTLAIGKPNDRGIRKNSKLFSSQMKSIVGTPCFDRVGCDRAGGKPADKRTTPPETWEPRWKKGRLPLSAFPQNRTFAVH